MKYNYIPLILALVLTICLASFVSAESQQSMPPQKQFTDIVISQSGDIDGVSFSQCNITSIRVENGSSLIPQVEMTPQNGEFIYILNSQYTQQLGQYIVAGKCNGYSFVFDFEVTTTGEKMNTSLWVTLIMIVISIILLVFGIFADNQYLGFLSSIGIITSSVFVLIYGLGLANDLYTRSIAGILFGFGVIILFVSAFRFEKDDEGLLSFFNKSPEVDRTDYFNEEFD